MKPIKTLRKKLNQRFAQKQDELERVPGEMTKSGGNLIPPGLSNFVYVAIADRIMPVFNNRVAPQAGVKVWVGYASEEPTLFQVLSTRSETPASGNLQGIGYAPAKRYEWNANGGGQDPLSVHLRAFSPLKLSPSATGGMNVSLYKGTVHNGTTYYSIATQDIDLTAHIPSTASKAALVMITINNVGTVIQTKGSEVDIDALVASDRPAVPANTIFVCGCVRVYNGQTVVRESRANTDFDDFRFPGLFQAPAVNGIGDVIDSGIVVGQLVKGVTDSKHVTAAALIPPATNILTLTATAASTLGLAITAGKTLTLTATDNFNLTIPATGTAAILERATQTFTGQVIFGGDQATAVPLIVQSASGSAANNIVEFRLNAGTVIFQYDKNGTVRFPSTTTTTHFGSGTGANLRVSAAGFDMFSTGTKLGALGISGTRSGSAALGIFGVANRPLQLGYYADAGISYNVEIRDKIISTLASATPLVIETAVDSSVPAATFLQQVSATNSIVVGEQLIAISSGTVAAGFGGAYQFISETATASTNQIQAQIASLWTDATNATRKAKLQLSAYDTAQRIGLEILADGTLAQLVNFGTLTLRTGSATALTAPIKFVAGTLMTVEEAGAMEFDGDYFYSTAGVMTGIPHRRRIVTDDRAVSFNDEPIYVDDDIVLL